MFDPIIQRSFQAKLSLSEFKKLSEFIYTNYGIKMPEVKRIMLQSRLQKRLRALKMDNFKDYIEYVFSKEGQSHEIINMIDVVSTNKTDFFREPVHYDYINSYIIPSVIDSKTSSRYIKVWSAGCSSGEEPFTLAITFEELKHLYPGFDYQIYATDISSTKLQEAVAAIYKEDKIENLPLNLKKKYFLKSKNREEKKVRIIENLRKKITFGRLNLMDSSYGINEKFDIVFCRNVLIYFDRITQESVINKLCNALKPGGFFFLGHSESITNFKVPLKQIKPTFFQRI
ncbi:MAG: methyltransferase domain-containing protein [Bacteroidales bacterium]|nr:methyltransferase domain-containing protein [Bacteroidales bacterium]